jgi:hypothetical protein
MSDLRARTIRLAHVRPDLRPYLIPLVVDRVAMEFETQDALDKYLEDHPGADKSKHTVKDQAAARKTRIKEHVKHILFDDFKDAWAESKALYQDLVDTVKPTRPSRQAITKAFQGANKQTKTFFSSPRYRRKKMQALGGAIKKGANAISHRISHAIKAEVEEVGVGVKAIKQVLTPGSAPLSKKQKKAVYGLGAYVAGASMAAAGGGVLMASAAVGKAFSLHVGMKAVSHLADSFFTHYEWGVEASHAAHGAAHLVKGIKSVLTHIAADRTAGGGSDSDDDQVAIVEAMVLAVAKVLDDGMDEDAVRQMLSGADDDAYDDVDDIPAMNKLVEKSDASGSKKAALRERVIRLAYTRPDLRPHLLPIVG